MDNWYNPYITAAFLTWVVAQLAKFFIAAIRNRNQFDFHYLYASGGMPSAHSAVVCSLAVTALLRDGVGSAVFGITAILAGIVMYDSFGVRRAAGEQAAAINSIFATLERGKDGAKRAPLREILGHKPLEVTIGAFTGIILGLVFNYTLLEDQLDWLASFPTKTEAIIYGAVSLALVLIGLVSYWYLKRRFRGSKVMASIATQQLVKNLTIGLTGMLLAFAGYERAMYLGWRIWIYLLAVAFVLWAMILVSVYWKSLPETLRQEAEKERLKKYLPTKRKRSRKG